jgi:hypothetical protein
MTRSLKLELSEEAFRALEQRAAAAGASPAAVAASALENHFRAKDSRTDAEKQAARERLERHFGAVSLGAPTGVDNESIDADLARSYADTHEDD